MEQAIGNYSKYYDSLKKEMKWKVSDRKILMTIASVYAMNQRDFQLQRFQSLAEAIQSRAKYFSYLRMEARYTTAALLDVYYDEPEKHISTLFSIYHEMVAHKFRRDVFTYIAASVLLKKAVDESVDYKPLIEKTKAIYDGMKKEHPFLTSAEDYPLAALLATVDQEEVIQRSERFYKRLNERGFKKGNDLQFMSHILSLNTGENDDELVERALQVFDSFKTEGLKTKPMFYPVIGMLALLPSGEVEVNVVRDLYKQLNQDFKWQKDFNLILAVSFFMKDKCQQSNIAETGLYTIIESILQAQQAAIAASAAAGAAAASSSSGNS